MYLYLDQQKEKHKKRTEYQMNYKLNIASSKDEVQDLTVCFAVNGKNF